MISDLLVVLTGGRSGSRRGPARWRCVRTRVRPLVVSGCARVGDAPMRSLRPRWELGAHLAHAIAQADHVVEASAGEFGAGASTSARRGRSTARPSPALRWDAAAWDHCLRWGRGVTATGARGAPGPSGSARCCPYRETAPARAACGRAPHLNAASCARPGCTEAPAPTTVPHTESARGRNTVAAVVALRRIDTRPPSRSSRRWYETRFCGRPARSHSSPTRRSLRASSLSSRHRSGCPASRRTRGGEPPPCRVVAITRR